MEGIEQHSRSPDGAWLPVSQTDSPTVAGETSMKIGILMIVALVTTLPAWSADAPAAGTTAQPTPEQIVSDFRKDLEAKSADVMAKALTLSADQAAKFWPLYKEYQKEQSSIVDGQVQATQKYAASYAHLTDAEALAYVTALLERDQKIHDLRVKWLAKFQTVVPGTTAARAIQVERRLGLVTQVGVSSQVPLVR
jgi:Spy/CpxP family protein refolding chaperone